jgi:ParB family chromosome partitioning protein
MGKRELLLKEMGQHLEESIGVRPAPGRPFLQAAPARAKAAPRDGFTRHRAAGEMLLENIVPDPDQPRREFDEGAIERLSQSIQARGLLQPLRVRWHPTLEKHVILVGERRYRAAKRAGLTTVPCLFVETALTEAEILEEQLAENLLREDLNPIEQAHSFRRYMELVGCPPGELAQLLKVDRSTVSRALSLLKLPGAVQEQVAAGAIPAKTGVELAKLSNPGAQQELAGQVVREQLTAAEAAAVVRQKRGRAAGKKRRAKAIFRLPDGFQVVVTSPYLAAPEQVARALDQALEIAVSRFR